MILQVAILYLALMVLLAFLSIGTISEQEQEHEASKSGEKNLLPESYNLTNDLNVRIVELKRIHRRLQLVRDKEVKTVDDSHVDIFTTLLHYFLGNYISTDPVNMVVDEEFMQMPSRTATAAVESWSLCSRSPLEQAGAVITDSILSHSEKETAKIALEYMTLCVNTDDDS